MDNETQTTRGIKSADRVFDIVELLFESGGMTTSELAEEMGLAISTVHEYLKTCKQREYVTKNADGTYRLSLKFLDLGEVARQGNAVYKTAKQPLARIADETGEVAWLYTEEHGYAVPLDVEKGQRGVQVVGRIGNRKPIHHISAGKAMLAEMPRERVESILDRHGLAGATANTLTDRDAIFETLETIRERGYALNDGEEVDGIRAVGMAIVTDGEIHGALSVSGPSNRVRGERFREELPEILSGAVNEVELKLTYE
ncbi:MAG: IclR family transcriptional regulator [Haloplanus sp.]